MRYYFGVCPHDTLFNSFKWFSMCEYISKKSGIDFTYQKLSSFSGFEKSLPLYSISYSHIVHSLISMNKLGFVPIAKFDKKYDECVFFSRKFSLEDGFDKLSHKKISIIKNSPSHINFLLLMKGMNLNLDFIFCFKDSYQNVLSSVLVGEADFGVLLGDFWSEMAKSIDLNVIAISENKKLSHYFMGRGDINEKMQECFFNMHADPDGLEVMKAFGGELIVPCTSVDLEEIEKEIKSIGIQY